MLGHAHQGAPLVTPVLHELAWQLHRIPLHVVDPGGLGALHGGEHVLEPMAEFMEEGFHLFEGHQAWGVRYWGALVADQIGHGQHRFSGFVDRAAQAFIHPGAPSLRAWSAEGIQVKSCQRFTAGGIQHVKVLDIGMPEGR